MSPQDPTQCTPSPETAEPLSSDAQFLTLAEDFITHHTELLKPLAD